MIAYVMPTINQPLHSVTGKIDRHKQTQPLTSKITVGMRDIQIITQKYQIDHCYKMRRAW